MLKLQVTLTLFLLSNGVVRLTTTKPKTIPGNSASSVTKLGYFKVLNIKFLTTLSQIAGNFLGYFEKCQN